MAYIVGQRDMNITCAMKDSGFLSDHILVRSKMTLKTAPPERRQRLTNAKKLIVKALASNKKVEELHDALI